MRSDVTLSVFDVPVSDAVTKSGVVGADGAEVSRVKLRGDVGED